MAETNNTFVIDQAGLSTLAAQLFGKVNDRISQRIVNVLNESSDALHVPSAQAVYSAIRAASHLTIETVTGDITSADVVPTPDSSVLYLQRDDEADTTWTMYIWADENWLSIGNTEVDLTGYWAKDDVDAMKEALGINDIEAGGVTALTEQQITDAVEAAFAATDPFTKPEE